MINIAGIVIVFVMVFGGYVAAGGHLSIIIEAVPFEMIIIGGAAVGSFALANDVASIKHVMRDMKKVFKGPKWSPADYRDLLCLLFEIIRLLRQNPVAIEEHIEAPESSAIFTRYPKILADHDAVEMICDTLRAASMNYDDPHQVEEVLGKRMEAQLHHAMHSSHALQSIADGLPALGIVAAVLGVIKTMGSIDQPPEVLGAMIGSALVGTFLGVLLAYGLVGPFATRAKTVIESDAAIYHTVKQLIIASLHGHPQPLVIEAARSGVDHLNQPSFAEVFDGMRGR